MEFNTITVSIRTKIVGLIVAAVTSVMVILVAIYVYDQQSQMREREARLVEDSIKSAAGLAYTVIPHFVESDYAFMNGLASYYARRAYRSYVMVVDNQNRILARSTEAELGDVFEIPAASRSEEIGGGLFQKYVHGGKTFYDVSYPVKAGDLVLGKVRIGLNTDWIGNEKEKMTKTILEFIGVALAVTIASILAAFGMARKLTGPLMHLAMSAQEVGKGDFTQKVQTKKRGDEVSILADSFNVMTENLRRSRVQLVEKDYVDSIMAAMEDCLIVISREGLIGTVNNYALELLGYERSELVNQPVEIVVGEWLFGPEEIDDSAGSGLPNRSIEGTFRTKAGRKIPMLFSVSSLGGKFHEGLLLVGKDITERKRSEEALRAGEKKLRMLFDSASDAIFILDLEGNFIDVNRTGHERMGYTKGEMLSMNISYIDHPDFAVRVPERLACIEEGGHAVFESAHLRKDGTVMPVEVNSRVIELEGRKVFFSVIRDITERKRAEAAIIQSEKRFRALFDNTTLGIAIVDLNRRFVDCNPAFQRMLGYSLEELKDMTVPQVSYPEDDAKSRAYHAAMLEGKTDSFSIEKRYIRKEGTLLWTNLTGTLIRDDQNRPRFLFAIVEDIAARKQAEEQIRSALLEKEILLKEIHHRVKNNLQVVSSMLRLQSDYISDNRARTFFDESRKRVETMSLIHEKLYRAKDLARIDFGEYVDDLAANLSIMNADRVGRVGVKTDVEGIMLDVNNSIPCGLIINELVSNAFKHAFMDGRRGEVAISMRRDNEKRIVLEVSDDGMGFPEGVDFRNTSSLGLQLVNSLVTQLDGTIAMDRAGGTVFRIEFKA